MKVDMSVVLCVVRIVYGGSVHRTLKQN